MTYKGAHPLIRSVIFSIFFAGLLASCGPTKDISPADYVYFRNGPDTITGPRKETLIQPNDLLGIQVYSKTMNQEQAAIFNIPPPPTSVGTAGTAVAGGSTQGYQQGYEVNAAGNIEMPLIGPVKAAGLTIDELQTDLVKKITNNVKNPSVIVRFLNFNINLLGEVHSPGTHKFYTDRVTIFDALGAAGDLTDYGRRDSIIVIREEGGKKIYHLVDLRNKAIFKSPVYIMEPNDVVYVSPNQYKLRNLSLNPDKQRSTALTFVVISTLVSIATLVIIANHW